MRSALKNAKLYLVLDTEVCDYDRLFEILKLSVRCGVDIVQLRDKKGYGRDALRFSQRSLRYLGGRIPFIVNDRVDVAWAARADGVHLGQEDVPIKFARKMLGKKKIVGVSCQTLPQAQKAQQAGADYIGFGSIFKTLTKPGRKQMDLRLLSQIVKRVETPVFGIGGLNLDNIDKICGLGVKRVAVTRAICLADDVRQATQKFCNILQANAYRH